MTSNDRIGFFLIDALNVHIGKDKLSLTFYKRKNPIIDRDFPNLSKKQHLQSDASTLPSKTVLSTAVRQKRDKTCTRA